MKLSTKILLSTISAMPILAQRPVTPTVYNDQTVFVSRIDPALKVFPIERWKTAELPPIPKYPQLAHMAGIEGELMFHVKVEPDGSPSTTKLISGPPQLASTLDGWIRRIKFKPLPTDGPGPWHYAISASFKLTGNIQLFPSAIKLSKSHETPK